MIIGIGEPLIGRLLLIDALTMQFRAMRLRKDPNCPACGTREIRELIDYDQFCGIGGDPLQDPHGIPELTPAELATKQQRKDDFELIDVREPHEWAIARIPGARLVPLSAFTDSLSQFDSARDIVVHCKMGGRSAPGADAIALVSLVLEGLAVAAVWVLYARVRDARARLPLAFAAAIAGFIAFTKVFSPQYLVWLLPAVALVPGRRGIAAALALVVSLTLTQVWTPFHYAAFITSGSYAWVVLLRDLVLAVLVGVLALPVSLFAGRVRDGPGRQPAAA